MLFILGLHAAGQKLCPAFFCPLHPSSYPFHRISLNLISAPHEVLLKKIIEKSYRERFLVYSKDKLIPIYTKEVAYFESTDGTTSLVTFNNERYYINESLDLLEEEVDTKSFFRINRQVLASAASIVSIYNFGLQKLKVSLKPGTSKEYIISKLKATAFKSWLNR
jgi:two-component system, LytTR family, response regulator LytT